MWCGSCSWRVALAPQSASWRHTRCFAVRRQVTATRQLLEVERASHAAAAKGMRAVELELTSVSGRAATTEPVKRGSGSGWVASDRPARVFLFENASTPLSPCFFAACYCLFLPLCIAWTAAEPVRAVCSQVREGHEDNARRLRRAVAEAEEECERLRGRLKEAEDKGRGASASTEVGRELRGAKEVRIGTRGTVAPGLHFRRFAAKVAPSHCAPPPHTHTSLATGAGGGTADCHVGAAAEEADRTR